MINTPIYKGLLQSDLDFAGFNALNFSGGGSGSGMPVTNIKSAPYNAAGNGVTDDTAALQSAVNALAAVGGGSIYFPPGTYLIGGALQDTSGRNAQILLPIVGETASPVTIQLVGALPPPTQYYFAETLQPTAYSIIKSTLTGGTGTAAFIAGKENGSDLWGNVQLIVRDLVFQAPSNPTFTAFNCFNLMGPTFRDVLIHCGALRILDIVQPTNTNATAIKLAPSSHSAGQEVRNVNVFGFYTGLQDGELADNDINLWGCIQAVTVPANYHMSVYRRLGVFSCPRGIVAAGTNAWGPSDGTHYLRVTGYSAEHTTSSSGFGQAWQNRVYDIDDSGNLLKGDLKWLSVLGGAGNDHTFIKNGGTGLTTSEVGDSTAYIGTDLRMVSITGGGKLQARNPGTNTWADVDQWTNP